MSKLQQTKTEMTLLEEIEGILSVIRHQLGNSTNALKITLDVLYENLGFFDQVKKKEYLNRALKLVGRQMEMIEGLKSYSKFSVKKQKEMSVLPFLEQFVSAASNSLKSKNIKFLHHLEMEPCLIVADDMALKRVLSRVFENAVEAVKDSEDPEIELAASRNNDLVMIRMTDNGLGIDERDIGKTFIPLYSKKPGKRGMGLSIARKLVSEMGGNMELESEVGKGTEVKVWLRVGPSCRIFSA